jgi:hypothetical protein
MPYAVGDSKSAAGMPDLDLLQCAAEVSRVSVRYCFGSLLTLRCTSPINYGLTLMKLSWLKRPVDILSEAVGMG